jgi:hypothetical protein
VTIDDRGLSDFVSTLDDVGLGRREGSTHRDFRRADVLVGKSGDDRERRAIPGDRDRNWREYRLKNKREQAGDHVATVTTMYREMGIILAGEGGGGNNGIGQVNRPAPPRDLTRPSPRAIVARPETRPVRGE